MIAISKEAITKLPIIAWRRKVRVLRNKTEMRKASKEILKSGEKHLGFDIEATFCQGRRTRPALVQLATPKTVYLFCVNKLKFFKLEFLIGILQDDSILKTGHRIHTKVRELQRVQPFEPAGFVECATTLPREQFDFENPGLQDLTAHFLRGRLDKGAKMSNWAHSTLTREQINYAATHAWVAREIHVRALLAQSAAEQVEASGSSSDG